MVSAVLKKSVLPEAEIVGQKEALVPPETQETTPPADAVDKDQGTVEPSPPAVDKGDKDVASAEAEAEEASEGKEEDPEDGEFECPPTPEGFDSADAGGGRRMTRALRKRTNADLEDGLEDTGEPSQKKRC